MPHPVSREEMGLSHPPHLKGENAGSLWTFSHSGRTPNVSRGDTVVIYGKALGSISDFEGSIAVCATSRES